MKKLEELGISPAPWKYVGYYDRFYEVHFGEVRVDGSKRKLIADISQPNARLIAAAPDLYDKAYKVADNLRLQLAIPTQSITMNRAEVEAMAKELESALAKAAGEEVADGK